MTAAAPDMPAAAAWLDAFRRVRARTLALAEGLSEEDCLLQSMEEASPVKWHLAHTTWFFESFVLARGEPGFRPHCEAWLPLFNSYYLGLGHPFARARRGLLSRPSLPEILAWRAAVDARVAALLQAGAPAEVMHLLETGLHHEEQHQELILTDLKHHLWCNPLMPAYRPAPAPDDPPGPLAQGGMGWRDCGGGLVEIGGAPPAGQGGDALQQGGFAFDHELPRHPEWVAPFSLATRLVTNSEYLAFMLDGGYGRPDLWLSDGWATCQREAWQAPLYWFRREDHWWQFTLSGPRPVRLEEPVCHVSFYEACAYARWARSRLPTEAEWECVAREQGGWRPDPPEGDGPGLPDLQPAPAGAPQFFGAVWQWTGSAYRPYPGYREPAGAVGEYNGKFMSGQMVLRGASCVTPRGQWRPGYRNFFAPGSRWQYTGIRLAREAGQA